MLNRRQFIQAGVAGAALLGAARLAYGPLKADPEYEVPAEKRFRALDGRSRTAFAAIARVMLAGALPRDEAEYETALHEVVLGCDTVVAGLPGPVRDELEELLSLLNHPLGRRWVAGVTKPWEQASADDVGHFLSRWRYSSFLLLRSGYQALHQIVFAAWYGNPRSWVGIGYAGPPAYMKEFWNA